MGFGVHRRFGGNVLGRSSELNFGKHLKDSNVHGHFFGNLKSRMLSFSYLPLSTCLSWSYPIPFVTVGYFFFFCSTSLFFSVLYGNNGSCGSLDLRRIKWQKNVVKSTVFRDMTLCSPLKVSRRFGGTYYLQLQGRKESQASNWQAACFMLDSLLGIFFELDGGGDVLLRKFCWLSSDHTGLIPEDSAHNHC